TDLLGLCYTLPATAPATVAYRWDLTRPGRVCRLPRKCPPRRWAASRGRAPPAATSATLGPPPAARATGRPRCDPAGGAAGRRRRACFGESGDIHLDAGAERHLKFGKILWRQLLVQCVGQGDLPPSQKTFPVPLIR